LIAIITSKSNGRDSKDQGSLLTLTVDQVKTAVYLARVTG
jgi:hypothetical protein